MKKKTLMTVLAATLGAFSLPIVPAGAEHCPGISIVAGVDTGAARAGVDLAAPGCASATHTDTALIAEATHYWVLVPYETVPATGAAPTGRLLLGQTFGGGEICLEQTLAFSRNDPLSRWESQSVEAPPPEQWLLLECGHDVLRGSVNETFFVVYRGLLKYLCDHGLWPIPFTCMN